MKELLKDKKQSLTYDLENQKLNDDDYTEAQKKANEALNNHLQECEQKYEIEKIKINAKLELIEELLAN